MAKRIYFLSFVVILLLILGHSHQIFADTWMPTATKVYFSLNGKPYYGSVNYTVKCYGYEFSQDEFSQVNYGTNTWPPTRTPGTYESVEVYSYSAKCPSYGCEVYEPYAYKYIGIDYCSMEGIAKNQNFVVKNIGSNPYSQCTTIKPNPYLKDGKFVRETPKWRECYEKAEYKGDECHKYLVKCDESTSSLEDCQEQGGWYIDGEKYARDVEGKYTECQQKASNEYNLQKDKCDIYLEEIPLENISFTDRCDVTWDSCTLRVDLSSNIDEVNAPAASPPPTRPSNEECFQRIIAEEKSREEQRLENQAQASKSGSINQVTQSPIDQQISEYSPKKIEEKKTIVTILNFLLLGCSILMLLVVKKYRTENLKNPIASDKTIILEEKRPEEKRNVS